MPGAAAPGLTVPETVRLTPSETEARGRAVVEDLSPVVESGVAVAVRAGGGLAEVEDASGVLPAAIPAVGALGAID